MQNIQESNASSQNSIKAFKIKLIFANSEIKKEIEMPPNSSSNDLRNLLKTTWPPQIGPYESVERIRLIKQGKEMIKDELIFKNPDQNQEEIPLIHIFYFREVKNNKQDSRTKRCCFIY